MTTPDSTSSQTASPIPGAKRIALVAGETSGDQLGAGLIAQLRARFPDAQFSGIGGAAMRAEGLDPWYDCSELAVMGLAEVLRHLPRLLRLRWTLRKRLLAWKPDVFIGIDAPDFNLGVERWLKRRGIRTVHYVGPSVWAWRENRAENIGQSADRVLCLFPMEPPIYARYGVDARFVGHPLADAIPLAPDRAAAREALGLDPQLPTLALLPGSRLGEIAKMLAIFLEAAELILQQLPTLRILIPAANAGCDQAIRERLAAFPALTDSVRVLEGDAQRAMIASDVVLLASGTAALEAMLCKRPMVVGHRISPTTYRIVTSLGLLKTHHISLPNVLAGEGLVPELLQHDCTPSKLAAALLRWLGHPAAADALLPRFEAIHRELRCDASARAADAVAELLNNPATAHATSDTDEPSATTH